MKKKNKIRGLALSNIKVYYIASVIKVVWYWWKNKQVDQWNITESPEIKPCKCVVNWSLAVVQRQYREANIVFSTDGSGKTIYVHICLSPPNQDTDLKWFMKVHSKWFRCKCRTVRLEDNTWENLDDLGYGYELIQTSKTWSIHEGKN